MEKFTFTDFTQTLKPEEIQLAEKIDNLYLLNGCRREIKTAASGFTVSYISEKNKKTMANFVCRKTGLKIRITPLKPFSGDDLLAEAPENMQHDSTRGNDCKRLTGASVCNPRCAMGYTLKLNGKIYHKCRSMAFLFAVIEENMPTIIALVQRELNI